MSNKTRLDRAEDEIGKLKKRLSSVESTTTMLHEKSIIDDLTKERFPGSGKNMFSYDDIAKRNGVSPSKVSRVAEKNNLSRRGDIKPV
jgi:predicted nuclease with TOPRIM domain